MRLATLFVFILLSGCATVKIPDSPWCADAGKFGAECFYTISKKEFSLDKFQWDKLRLGQICSATEERGKAFSDLRKVIEKLCADSSKCTYEEAEVAERVKRKALAAIDAFTRQAGRASFRALYGDQ